MKRFAIVIGVYLAARLLLFLAVSGAYNALGMPEIALRLHGVIPVTQDQLLIFNIFSYALGTTAVTNATQIWAYWSLLEPGALQNLIICSAITIAAVVTSCYLVWAAYDKARTRKLLRQAAMTQIEKAL